MRLICNLYAPKSNNTAMYYKLLIVFLVFSSSCLGQGLPFKKVNEFYLNGDTRVIGNTILSDHPTRVYRRSKGLNDRTEMVYIDVDNNKETYSSSSATLELPEHARIKYAGLYWAATYPGERGKQKTRKNRIDYVIKKKRSIPFDQVQLQLPGSDAYHSVMGEVLYDGMQDQITELKNAAPYVCYSDITTLLQTENARSGTYTLANVTALEGYMYGGSSAGWMLYLVFEDPEAPLQYFAGYHGFSFINPNNSQELDFNNFRVVENGSVNTSITLAALEGDLILVGDQVGVYSEKEDEFVPLKSRVRYANNFFNSSITIGDKKYIDRIPENSNTLGFDLAKVDIPNENNALIANDATRMKLQFKTESDRLFVFFNAFQTEISTDFYQRVIVEGKPDRIPNKATLTTQEGVKNRATTEAEKEDVAVLGKDGETLKTAQGSQEIPVDRPQALQDMLATKPMAVPGMDRGYYIVNHVFAQRKNALRWQEKMKLRGLSPVRFVNPENNYHYIYIDYSTNPDALYERLVEFRKLNDFEDAWIIKVNL